MKQFAYRCIFACSARQGSGSAGGYSHGSLQEEKTFFFQVECSLTLQGRLAVDLKLWPVFLIPLQLLSWIETSCWCITICKCLKQLLLVFLATCTVEGKKKKGTFIQTLRIAGYQFWLTQAIVCMALFNKFSPRKKSPVGINWAPKILIYTVSTQPSLETRFVFLIQPFQVTGLSGFQFLQHPHKITQIVLGMTIVASLLTV